MEVTQQFQNDVMLALGNIQGSIDAHAKWMSRLSEDDQKMASEIVILKEKNAGWKGVLTGAAAVGSLLGASLGYAIQLFKSH